MTQMRWQSLTKVCPRCPSALAELEDCTPCDGLEPWWMMNDAELDPRFGATNMYSV